MAGPRKGFGARLDDLIAPFAPAKALARSVARARRDVLTAQMSHYEGAGTSGRSKDFRRNRTDAVEAARGARQPLSFMSRDMLRNNPRARRIRRQLMNNVVGAGILPTVKFRTGMPEVEGDAQRVKDLFDRHCASKLIDTEGMLNIFAMQGLTFSSIVSDGEVLLRRRQRRLGDGLPLNFQVQVLEADYLDPLIDGELENGNYAVQGIEFDRIGRRVAYHLYPEHPGGRRGFALTSRRVSAENVIHAFLPERPGMARGVSWFAPVMTKLHELDKYQDGQIKRQEIAALFAGILKSPSDSEEFESSIGDLEAGTVLTLGEDESMEFTDPPTVEGYEDFMRVTDRVIAAAMGITYEALTGDYSQVNYTSGRMGRMDVDPNVRDWQNNLMIAQVCEGLGRWIKEAIEDVSDIPADAYDFTWTAPVRPVVDPTRDHKADEIAMRSGKKSRRQVIREAGHDPAAVEKEIQEERAWEAEQNLLFTSNASSIKRPDSAPRQENEDDDT